MDTSDPRPAGSLSRSEFLWLAGLSAAAAAMAPSALWAAPEPAANPGATSSSRAGQKRITTDVLVIGGGMAGTFAAVKAREKGLNVVLADKGTVGKSGCTPWARGFVVFDSASGDNKSQWIENMSRNGEYINNRDSLDAVMADSLARYNDLVSWGAIKEGIVNHGPVLRGKLSASGVQLIERSMMTHLLLRDGRVAGAMGFSLDDEEAVAITAKAVIMCAGSGGFKPYGFPISSLTSDGDAMAYRAGAIITGKEFNDFHFTKVKYPASCWNNWGHEWVRGSIISRTSYGRGGGGPGGAPDLACALLADAGKAPVSMRGIRPSGESGAGPSDGPSGGSGGGPGGGRVGGPGSGARPGGGGPPGGGPRGGPRGGAIGSRPGGAPRSGRSGQVGPTQGGRSEGPQEDARADGPGAGGDVLGAGTGMSIHKAEGIWPANNQGGTNIPGLFSAGDGLGSMLCGAKYGGQGFSLCGSAVQGARAGQSAAAYAAQNEAPAVVEDQIASVRTALFAPRERKTGFTPAWITQVLQNTMFPCFVLCVKKKEYCAMAIQSIDTQKCIGCGTCVATCPMDVFRLNDKIGKSAITYPEDCQICHLCCVYCPKQAITVSHEKRMPVLVAWG